MGKSKTDRWVQVTILLIYYRFIVRFTIAFEFLFIAFLHQFFWAHMSTLPISSARGDHMEEAYSRAGLITAL